FARGDRRLSAVLERAVELGCRFDGWRECFDFSLWQQAFSDCDIDPSWYLRQRDEDEILPWEHIDCGVPKKFFLSERHKAIAGVATLDCRDGNCHGCDICDFEELRMRQINPTEMQAVNPTAPAEKEEKVTEGEQLTRVRLKLSKLGRARMVGHLEYLKMFQRAVSRAKLPIRFSQGFHPMPKISYLEALPMGVSSEAELVDLELLSNTPVAQVINDINVQLPIGFKIIEGEIIPWKSPSPSAIVASSCYRVPLPESFPEDLPERISRFLDVDQILVSRIKKGIEKKIDIRSDVLELSQIGAELQIELIKGGPLQVAANVLGLEIEDIRRLGVRKTGIILKT
ncbi:MAG: TIGR03936 family radical SAM-associated protein, partial [Desulfuromusa sp.]|nr:TIGR03936 family radical SAM-associated protein [Desulfuromusa sp.]